MDDKTVEFIPYHAINEFMRDDYRTEVIRVTLSGLSDLSDDTRHSIDKLTRRYIQVVGFRNSSKAPVALRIKPSSEAFTKHSQFVSAILSAWTELHPELSEMVAQTLKNRNWEILPVEADRTKLPGFLSKWPQGENFELIQTAYRQNFPDSDAQDDDISLMVVWLSGRLPYVFEESQSIE